MVTGATLTQAENLKVLVDLRDLDVPFQAAAIVMSEKFVTTNPQAAEAFVKGAWDGTRFLVDPNNKATVVESIKRNLNLDNAAAESFNSTVEFELLREHRFTSREQARRAVAAWIDEYNTIRRHSTNGLLSPVDYERVQANSRPGGHPEAAA